MLCNWTFRGEAVIAIVCSVRDDISQVLSIYLLENKTGSYAHISTKGHQTKHFGLCAGVIMPQPKLTVDVRGTSLSNTNGERLYMFAGDALFVSVIEQIPKRGVASLLLLYLVVCLFSFLFVCFVFGDWASGTVSIAWAVGGGGTFLFILFAIFDHVPFCILNFSEFVYCVLGLQGWFYCFHVPVFKGFIRFALMWN